MPCSFSSREAISHDHQSHAQTSWIRRSSPPFRGIGRAHPWIYHRTGGRVGCKLRLGAGFRKPVPTLLLEHRSRKSGKNFVAPLLYITDRNNVIVVASALGQAENPQWYRNLPPNPDTHIQIGSDRRPVSRRGQLGRAGAPMAAPSRRLRRLRFLPKLDRAWDSGDHLAATLIGVGLLRVVERSRCGYPLRVLSAPRSARPPREQTSNTAAESSRWTRQLPRVSSPSPR